jgi:hypothetical protein
MMETKFVYDLLLPYFVGDDELRPALTKVHRDEDGYIYATNGHILIRVAHDKVMNKYWEVPGFPFAKGVMRRAVNREDNIKASIRTNDLIRVLSHARWWLPTEAEECEKCEGYGSVPEGVTEDSGWVRCETCKGAGRVNIRFRDFALTETDGRYYIKIVAPVFAAGYLNIIATAAQMLQADKIEYMYADEEKGAVFSFAGVDILLVPCTNWENETMTLE